MQAKALIKICILVLVSIYLGNYIFDNISSFKDIANYSLVHTVSIAFLYVIFFSVNALVLIAILKDYDYNCDFLSSFKITVVSSLLSYAGFFKIAGVGYKAFALTRGFKVNARDVAGIVLLTTYFSILVSSFVISVGVVAQYKFELAYLSLAVVTMFGMGLIPFLHKMYTRKDGVLAALFWKVLSHFRVSSVQVFTRYITLFFVQFMVGCAITFFLFDGLGNPQELYKCILINAMSSLALIISITPANIGVREVIYIGLGAVLNIDGPLMVSLSLIDRCIQFFTLLLLAVLGAASKNDWTNN